MRTNFEGVRYCTFLSTTLTLSSRLHIFRNAQKCQSQKSVQAHTSSNCCSTVPTGITRRPGLFNCWMSSSGSVGHAAPTWMASNGPLAGSPRIPFAQVKVMLPSAKRAGFDCWMFLADMRTSSGTLSTPKTFPVTPHCREAMMNGGDISSSMLWVQKYALCCQILSYHDCHASRQVAWSTSNVQDNGTFLEEGFQRD